MEAGLVGRTPGTQGLVGIHAGRSDGTEKVHAPLGALDLVDIKQSERDLHIRLPGAGVFVGSCLGREAVGGGIGHKEMVKRRTVGADLGRVENNRLVGDVGWVDFVFNVCCRVVLAVVEEGFHDLVFPDIVVCALAGVDVPVGLVQRFEAELDRGVIVAHVDRRRREGRSVWDRLVHDGHREIRALGDLKRGQRRVRGS